MFAPTKSMLLPCGLAIAVLFAMPLIPQAISQELQSNGTPLRDVCPVGWSRYRCIGIRLCISPEVENRYDASASPGVTNSCHSDKVLFGDKIVIPEAWTRATPEESGYSVGRNKGDYFFYSRVVKLDQSMIKNGDLIKTLQDLLVVGTEFESWSHGRAKWKPLVPQKSLEAYSLPPAPTTGKEVCPVGWAKFSCQFVRLCVSPSVAANYHFSTSREFNDAQCEADNHTVSENDTYCSPKRDTHCSPHDVGMAAGMLILGPRYLKAVKLDSSDIFDGNIEEAIQRLVLVPIPTSGLMEYDRGYDEGQAAFQKYLSENGQKDAKSPH
jgi:hypothetical protein